MKKRIKCTPQTVKNFYGEQYGEFEVTGENLYELFQTAEKKAKEFFGNVPMHMEVME